MDAVDLCRALELASEVWDRTAMIEENRVVRKDPDTREREVITKETEVLIDVFEFAEELREELKYSKHGHLGIVSTQPGKCVCVESGEFSAIIEVDRVTPETTLYHNRDRISEAQALNAAVMRAAHLDSYLDEEGYDEPQIRPQLNWSSSGVEDDSVRNCPSCGIRAYQRTTDGWECRECGQTGLPPTGSDEDAD